MFSRPGKMLAFAMVSVVLSFLATLWLAQQRLDVVEDEIATLTDNAMPSVETANDARAQLRRVAMQAHAHVEAGTDRATLVGGYEQLLRLRDKQLALPRFPGEDVLIGQLEAAMPSLGAALDAVMAAVDAGDATHAHQLLTTRLGAAVERVDAAFDGLAEFNAAHARDRVQAIGHARDAARRVGSLLGGISVVLALAASLLVVRALRRHARTVAERDRLLEARASEMEAFAYRVAHDLRGPLAGIALRLSTTELPESPERLRATHETLRRRVKHMAAIIEGLLEFARAGTVRNTGEAVTVAAVVDEVLGDVQPEAEAAGIAVSVGELPRDAAVACSAGVLSSVLSNLVRNAVKYVRTVERTNRRVAISGQIHGDRVRICVEDNGPGIPRDMQERIFRPFVRAADGHIAGLGLGLATVDRLVTAHGGRVGVRSEPGVGSMFWVELPAAWNPRPHGASLVAIHGGRA